MTQRLSLETCFGFVSIHSKFKDVYKFVTI